MIRSDAIRLVSGPAAHAAFSTIGPRTNAGAKVLLDEIERVLGHVSSELVCFQAEAAWHPSYDVIAGRLKDIGVACEQLTSDCAGLRDQVTPGPVRRALGCDRDEDLVDEDQLRAYDALATDVDKLAAQITHLAAVVHGETPLEEGPDER